MMLESPNILLRGPKQFSGLKHAIVVNYPKFPEDKLEEEDCVKVKVRKNQSIECHTISDVSADHSKPSKKQL
jgi:hypothetical protein